MQSHTILFIHGMYMTPSCWEKWLAFFREQGYRCSAPAWPGRDLAVEKLRAKHPDPELGKLGLSNIVESIASVIQFMEEKPILIGHSMGGLVVQLLLQRDLAAAGVAIDSAPPQGLISTHWSFLRSNWPHINPLVSLSHPIWMSFKRFQYTFVNGLPLAEQKSAYDAYVVPESRRVPRQSLTSAGKVDFTRPHPPLLLLAGSADHLIPASLNRLNYRKYPQDGSVTDFKEFPGRTHYTIGQSGWEEVAAYVKSWLVEKTA